MELCAPLDQSRAPRLCGQRVCTHPHINIQLYCISLLFVLESEGRVLSAGANCAGKQEFESGQRFQQTESAAIECIVRENILNFTAWYQFVRGYCAGAPWCTLWLGGLSADMPHLICTPAHVHLSRLNVDVFRSEALQMGSGVRVCPDRSV